MTEAQLVATYRDTVDALYGYASRKCGGQRELAEDVTQEAWLRAVREWHRTGLPQNPLAWLMTVARNLLLNHFRRHEPIPLDAVSPAALATAFDADTIGDSAETASVVNRALTRLPDEEAALLEAFHFRRCRMSELAVAYDTTERAIEGRLRRARERLRKELELTLPRTEGGVL